MAFPLVRLAPLPPTPAIDEFEDDDTIDNPLLCIDVDEVAAAASAAAAPPTLSVECNDNDDMVVMVAADGD